MLVLDRKPGEKIRIGDDITVQVLESFEPGKMRIGIEAPADIAIYREEIYKKMKPEARKRILYKNARKKQRKYGTLVRTEVKVSFKPARKILTQAHLMAIETPSD